MASPQEIWVPASGIQEIAGRDILVAPQLLDGIDPDAIEFRAARLHLAIKGLGGLNSLTISDQDSFSEEPGKATNLTTGLGAWAKYTSSDGTWQTRWDKAANIQNKRNGGLIIAGGAFVDTENPSPTKRAHDLNRGISVTARQAVTYHNTGAIYRNRHKTAKIAAGLADVAALGMAIGGAAYGVAEQSPIAPALSGIAIALYEIDRALISKMQAEGSMFDPVMSARPFRVVAANTLLRLPLVRASPKTRQARL